MNDLKVFSNSQFGELGVLMIDGKEFFPASLCAKLLGYSNPWDAIKRHCKTEGVVKREGVSCSTNQHGVTTQQSTEIKYINEGNLYRLIVSSKLPKAQEFESWIFDEVLPEIRKTGSYGNVDIEKILVNTTSIIITEVIKRLTSNEDNAKLKNQVSIKKPRRKQGVIRRLNIELRDEVDSMLANGYTYQEISDFLKGHGVVLSLSAIWRYAN